VFSSLTFKSKKIVLKEEGFINNVLVVNLEVFTMNFQSFDFSKKTTIQFKGNTQRYVDMKFFDDEKSSLKSKLFNHLSTYQTEQILLSYKV
jgi:hypothetical protein